MPTGHAICPHCDVNLTDADEADGFVTFYSSPMDAGDRAEGHFECPECEGHIYIDADLREVSEG